MVNPPDFITLPHWPKNCCIRLDVISGRNSLEITPSYMEAGWLVSQALQSFTTTLILGLNRFLAIADIKFVWFSEYAPLNLSKAIILKCGTKLASGTVSCPSPDPTSTRIPALLGIVWATFFATFAY